MNRMHDINYDPCDPEDIEEEQTNFLSILAAFKNYRWDLLLFVKYIEFVK